MYLDVPRLSVPDECPGPESNAYVVVEFMGGHDEVVGKGMGRLVPPDRHASRCSIRTGVDLLGFEISVDIDWFTLAAWVQAVLAARAADPTIRDEFV